MLAALQKWAAIGKFVPLAWSHEDEVVGHIDLPRPESRTTRSSQAGRSTRARPEAPRRRGLSRAARSASRSAIWFRMAAPWACPEGASASIDVYEIPVVPLGPANNETRVLSSKSLDVDPAAVRAEFKTLMRTLLDANDDPPDVRLRAKATGLANRVTRESTPVHVAEFPC